ncbi:unnamed protein product [Notodromas monacha]|uniref:J domain-containing protein n=1 Tax=Notodromas monacha TaxID=399045 RepID=A0A7R9GED9_9CRUS|nr:unnamed protein product [Notodromas monacha]CAG0919525.1 unnamed protein product [Notodromas monacha]
MKWTHAELFTHYSAILGVKPGADPEEIRTAYEAKLKKLSPAAEDGDMAAQYLLRNIQLARDSLLNDNARSAFYSHLFSCAGTSSGMINSLDTPDPSDNKGGLFEKLKKLIPFWHASRGADGAKSGPVVVPNPPEVHVTTVDPPVPTDIDPNATGDHGIFGMSKEAERALFRIRECVECLNAMKNWAEVFYGVALMTIENFHMVHGPIVLMSSAIALPMMCHAVWININGEIAWAMNLFPWMPFLMLTSKEWRGAAAAAGFSVFITGAIGIYGAHISKLEPLRNAMAAWLASYLFVVLHPDLNAGYSSIPLAGPLQVAGAQLIVELFKKAGPGEISRPVQFPPPKEGEQFAAGGGEYYY